MSLSFAVIMGNGLATLAAQTTILGAMWRHRQLRRMPWFSAYTLWVMATSVVILSMYLRSRSDRNIMPIYYYAGWIVEAVSVALGFMVVYEVFSIVFRPYETFRRVGPGLFRWCAVGLLLLGSASALWSSPDQTVKLTAGILVLERTLRLVQVALLVLVLGASRYLRISWRREVLGVALGFGMYAATSLVCRELQSQNGLFAYYLLGMVATTAYTCAAMIWAAYFLLPEPQAEPAKFVPRSTEVEQWNQALSHLLQR